MVDQASLEHLDADLWIWESCVLCCLVLSELSGASVPRVASALKGARPSSTSQVTPGLIVYAYLLQHLFYNAHI